MQTATSETENKSLDLIICVHHYTLRAPCPKSQGIIGPLQKASGPRKKEKAALSHFWDTHHTIRCCCPQT